MFIPLFSAQHGAVAVGKAGSLVHPELLAFPFLFIYNTPTLPDSKRTHLNAPLVSSTFRIMVFQTNHDVYEDSGMTGMAIQLI